MSAARRRVARGDGATVAEVLATMGDAVRGAAAQGRAFLNGRRARPEDPAREGDEIAVWSSRRDIADEAAAGCVEVLARWGELVVASKPASLPTTPDRRGTRSLVTELAELLDLSALPHAASRLDVGVSGSVLCAIGRSGQRHVAAMREAGRIARTYVGIAGGRIEGRGTWDAPIGEVRIAQGRSKPVVGGAGAQGALTRFQAIAAAGSGARIATLLRLAPETGRMHQLRVHAAHAGAPLLGDREHGGLRAVATARGRVISVARIALHAIAVAFPDEQGTPRTVVTPVTPDLRDLWAALDGDAAAWDEVVPAAPPA